MWSTARIEFNCFLRINLTNALLFPIGFWMPLYFFKSNVWVFCIKFVFCVKFILKVLFENPKLAADILKTSDTHQYSKILDSMKMSRPKIDEWESSCEKIIQRGNLAKVTLNFEFFLLVSSYALVFESLCPSKVKGLENIKLLNKEYCRAARLVINKSVLASLNCSHFKGILIICILAIAIKLEKGQPLLMCRKFILSSFTIFSLNSTCLWNRSY